MIQSRRMMTATAIVQGISAYAEMPGDHGWEWLVAGRDCLISICLPERMLKNATSNWELVHDHSGQWKHCNRDCSRT